jgi:hypothetical protein
MPAVVPLILRQMGTLLPHSPYACAHYLPRPALSRYSTGRIRSIELCVSAVFLHHFRSYFFVCAVCLARAPAVPDGIHACEAFDEGGHLCAAGRICPAPLLLARQNMIDAAMKENEDEREGATGPPVDLALNHAPDDAISSIPQYTRPTIQSLHPPSSYRRFARSVSTTPQCRRYRGCCCPDKSQ